MKQANFEYIELSVRVPLPHEVSSTIMREKMRFVEVYGSKYRSEPHITLYLARYTEEGLEKFPSLFQQLKYPSFSFTLLGLTVIEREYQILYNLDVSNKERFYDLHERISALASSYRSNLLRTAAQKRLAEGLSIEPQAFGPHITLGALSKQRQQPNQEEVSKNLNGIEGKSITVSEVIAYFYGKEKDDDAPNQLIKAVALSLQ